MIKRWIKNKYLLAAVAVSLFLSLFVFNSGFRLTIARTKAIHAAKAELAVVSDQVARLNVELAVLENSTAKENLVRRDLGYIRPGEKEVRFIHSTTRKEK